MSALTLRKVDAASAQFSRRLGAGASLAFSAQGQEGELTLRPFTDPHGVQPASCGFSSAIGVFELSDAEAMLTLLGDLPVTLAGAHQPWYWNLLNQRLGPVIAELLSPLEPLSDITALSAVADGAALSCRLHVRLGTQSLHGVIRADTKVLLRLLDGAGWVPHCLELDEQWPIDAALELGHVSLSLAQLTSLQPGDVLMPTHCHFDSNGNGRLQLGGRQWAVQTDSDDRQLYVRLSHEEAREHDQ